MKLIRVFPQTCLMGILSVAIQAPCATRLVQPGNSGAYATIASAVINLRAGDTVSIKAGVYRESVNIAALGAPSNPVVIRAFPGDEGRVIIRGSDVLTGWTLDNTLPVPQCRTYRKQVSHILVSGRAGLVGSTAAEYDKRVDMVFINGRPLLQVLSLDSLKRNSFFIPDTSIPRDLILCIPDSIVISSATVEVSVRQAGMWISWYNYPSRHSEYILIQGLTIQHVASTPSDVAPGQQQYSNALTLAGFHNTVENCRVEWNNWTGIRMSHGNNTIRNSSSNDNGHCGMDGGMMDCLFEHDTTNRNGWRFGGMTGANWSTAGMKWAGGDTLIRNNTFRSCVASFNRGPGLWFDFTGGNTLIEGGLYEGNMAHGVKVEAAYRNFGGFVIRNNIIRRNILIEPSSASQDDGCGILLYEASRCSVYNNTIVGNVRNGIVVAGGSRPLRNSYTAVSSYNRFFNNLFAFNGNKALYLHTWTGSSEYDSTHRFDYNLYHANGGNASMVWWRPDFLPATGPRAMTLAEIKSWLSQETHSVAADPKFADTAAGHFSLLASSPAIDAGADIGVTDDWMGTARPAGSGTDIGALEYIQPGPVERAGPNPDARFRVDPNPAASGSRIIFILPGKEPGTVKLFDMKGRWLKTLSAEKPAHGSGDIRWTAGPIPSGVYLLAFSAGRFKEMKRLVILK